MGIFDIYGYLWISMDFCFGYGENGVSQQNLTNLVTEPFNMENYEWNFGVQQPIFRQTHVWMYGDVWICGYLQIFIASVKATQCIDGSCQKKNDITTKQSEVNKNHYKL